MPLPSPPGAVGWEVWAASAAGWQWPGIRSGLRLHGSLLLTWGLRWSSDPLPWPPPVLRCGDACVVTPPCWPLPSRLDLWHVLGGHPGANLTGSALLYLLSAVGPHPTSGPCGIPMHWCVNLDVPEEREEMWQRDTAYRTGLCLSPLSYTKQIWATERNCGNFNQQLLGKVRNHLFLLSP